MWAPKYVGDQTQVFHSLYISLIRTHWALSHLGWVHHIVSLCVLLYVPLVPAIRASTCLLLQLVSEQERGVCVCVCVCVWVLLIEEKSRSSHKGGGLSLEPTHSREWICSSSSQDNRIWASTQIFCESEPCLLKSVALIKSRCFASGFAVFWAISLIFAVNFLI